jgi:YidC/Oxa1 family membrane protein insertase
MIVMRYCCFNRENCRRSHSTHPSITCFDSITGCRTDGVPSLGWDTTIAFLILPLFLVVSQFASMQLMQPKSEDPAQQQSNAILKFLPLMIGWFSLNVPAALCLYWVTNNLVTTASSVLIRNSIKTEPIKAAGTNGSTAASAPSSIFAPPREKPAGFGDSPRSMTNTDDVKPITAAIDAVIVNDTEANDEDDNDATTVSGSKKRGGKKRKKN